MSEKLTYILCGILFAALVVLMVLEAQYPEGGATLLQSVF